ncbi:hypothetical protein NRB20_67100 [Nocardia sp. RB20]|uniref:Uncharacterized protein n=1 Tax=Nocardia macrotermitis TaxID=2585198 RepID=A0A7K0DDA1_9NOCA|nr:hypothetical protein [Nocardia macrotermitis]
MPKTSNFSARLCGFLTVDEALDCVTDHYPPHLLTPKTEFLLRELLEE